MKWLRSAYGQEQQWNQEADPDASAARAPRFSREHPVATPPEEPPQLGAEQQLGIRNCIAAIGLAVWLIVIGAACLFAAYVPIHFIIKYW